jgi:hypothetical protein
MTQHDNPLSSEEILRVFRDLDLDTESKRQRMLTLVGQEPEPVSPNKQVFIRTESVTDPAIENR